MNFINPFTEKPETIEERIARYQDSEKCLRLRASLVWGGFKANLTKKANEKAVQIARLKEIQIAA